MTTLAAVLVALMSCINLTYAQEESASFMKETTPEQRAQFQTNYMKENLALTLEQENKVHEVNLRYAQKIQDAYGAQGRKVQKLKRMKTISDEKDKELKSILNPEQFATYEKNKEAMKEKIRDKAKEKKGQQ